MLKLLEGAKASLHIREEVEAGLDVAVKLVSRSQENIEAKLTSLRSLTAAVLNTIKRLKMS